jgi:hypothetical protein
MMTKETAMSICFDCKHFKQTTDLSFMISGYCDWKSPVALPPWLKNYTTSTDNFYGPKRDVGKFAYQIKSCDAFEKKDV